MWFSKYHWITYLAIKPRKPTAKPKNKTKVPNLPALDCQAKLPMMKTMKRISALLMDSGTGQNDGVLLRQTGSGTRVVTFKNELFSYIFASKYHYEDHEGDGTDVTGFFFKQPSYDTVDDCMRPGGVACEF